MYNHLFFVLLFFAISPAMAQHDFNPRVAVSYPNEVLIDDAVSAEWEPYHQQVAITDTFRQQFIPESLPENWKRVREKEIDFIANQDFAALLSLLIARQITYKENDYTDAPLIFPVMDQCAYNLNCFKTLTQKHDVDWLVNISKIEAKNEGGERRLKAKVEIYSVLAKRLVKDQSYEVGTEQVKSTTDCEKGSWDCALYEMVEVIAIDAFDRLEYYRKYWR